MKLPALLFYPGDWLKDPQLRRCAHEEKGVYIDMLCLMHECEERGVLATAGAAWSDEEVAQAIGGDHQRTLSCVASLVVKGVVSRNSSGAIYSRRMVRDENKRQKCSEAGRRGGGNPTFKGVPKGRSKGGPKGALEDESENEQKLKIPENLNNKEFLQAWTDYIEHRRQLKIKKYTLVGAQAQIDECAEWGSAEAVAAIRQSIRKNYHGIFRENGNGKNNSTGAFRFPGDTSELPG